MTPASGIPVALSIPELALLQSIGDAGSEGMLVPGEMAAETTRLRVLGLTAPAELTWASVRPQRLTRYGWQRLAVVSRK